MRRALAAAALAASLPLAPAGAQTIPSPYRFIEHGRDLGAFVGWIATDRGTVRLGPSSGLAPGLQFTFRINDPMALSARVAYFSTEREVIDTVTVDGALRTRAEGRAALDLLLAGARLQFTITGARTWHRIAPHIIAGAGLAIALSEETEAPTVAPTSRYSFGHAFLGQLGVGAVVFLSDRWAVRLSLLDHLWQIRAPEGLQNAALDPVAPEREWTHNAELSIGLHHYF
jgi:hypothetical protein